MLAFIDNLHINNWPFVFFSFRFCSPNIFACQSHLISVQLSYIPLDEYQSSQRTQKHILLLKYLLLCNAANRNGPGKGCGGWFRLVGGNKVNWLGHLRKTCFNAMSVLVNELWKTLLRAAGEGCDEAALHYQVTPPQREILRNVFAAKRHTRLPCATIHIF